MAVESPAQDVKEYGTAACPDSSPIVNTDRLQAKLREHDIEGEHAIAVGQAGICFFVLLLHLLAQADTAWQLASAWVSVSLAGLIVTSAVRYAIAARNVRQRYFDILTVVDFTIFMVLIWSYQFAYLQPAAGVLKAPSIVLLFALIALRALKSSPRSILVAGGAAVLGWCMLVAFAILKDGTSAITNDYTEYLVTFRIMLGAEVEKIAALAATTICLAVAASKARKILSQAAHTADYADALEAARRNLREATKAREAVEMALDALDQRDAELLEQNKRFNVALDNMAQGLCMFDADKNLVVCNDRYIEMYDLPPELAETGTSFRRVIEHRVHTGVYDGDDPEAYIQERLDAIDEGVPSTKIHHLTNGRIVAIVHQPMASGGWVATHDDITEIQRIEAQVRHMAHHDSLTDLPNRVLLRERIDDALKHARRGQGFAILCLDLDRFKAVNDTLGHPIGDKLLRSVATRLSGCVRETDTIARLGGDEFAIVQASPNQPHEATSLATRICEAIRQPFEIDGHHVVVDTSIGIAIAPQDGADPDHLLKSADMALYGAKSDGRGVFRFFEPEMDAQMKARRTLELDLRAGIEAGQFKLHYQPLLNIKNNDISGFEALLRWNHPERGMISPAEFIPVAEETGLIVPLGEWVIMQACQDAAQWPHNIKIAVNLSAVQFKNNNLVSTIVKALSNSQLAATRLELEITESVLLQDNASTLRTLHELRDLGVRIAMDDFGTGYSSLSYLRSFPFDKIKIDRSFVSDLTGREDSVAIIRAVASLGNSLGMITTAEGIETEDQLRRVHTEGCTEIQGYLCSPPRPAEEIHRMLFPDEERRRNVQAEALSA